METQRVDARGLSCPEPVLLARQAMLAAGGGAVEVLVDTTTSRENVTRMATGKGWRVEAEELENGEILLRLTRAEE